MLTSFICAVILVLVRCATACDHYHDPACQDVVPLKGNFFSNQFPVHVDGDDEVAKQVAEEVGFEYIGPVKGFDQHHFFKHPEVSERHKMKHEELVRSLESHDKVLTADQQFVWQPTIADVHDYKDMVGRSLPSEVKFSRFDPQEEQLQRDIPPVQVVDYTPDEKDTGEDTRTFRPLKDIVNLDEMYAAKKLEEQQEKNPNQQEKQQENNPNPN